MRDTLTALRPYLSSVLLRENGFLASTPLYVVLLLTQTAGHRHDTFWRNGHYSQPHDVATWWWLAQQTLFAGLAAHYWRQVRTPLIRFHTRILDAERRAIVVMLGLAVLLIALPMLVLSAPVLNVLALEAIALPVAAGSNIATPKALRGRTRWLSTGVTVLVFLLFLLPGMQERVLSAPWFVAAPLVLLGFCFTVVELDHTPGSSAPGVAAPAQSFGHAPRRVRLARILFWQTPWLRRPPVPQAFDATSPCLLLLIALVLTAGFMGVGSLGGAVWHGHRPSWNDAVAAARVVPQFICMIAAGSLSQWLVMRREWPFLLGLGPFGHRAAFARRLYRAHVLTALQAAVLSSVLACAIATLLGTISATRAPLAALAIGCVVMGSAYLPSLTVFGARTSRPGLVRLLMTLGTLIGVQTAAGLFLDSRPPPLWFWLVPALMVPFCAAVAWWAPKALAKADWPIEAPPL